MSENKNRTVEIAGRKVTLQVSPGVSEEELQDLLGEMADRAESPIRKLTQRELDLYGSAVRTAVTILPAFRDGIALMRPFFDLTAGTAYTDKFARVGLSPWFFFLSNKERATVVVHECMHIMNNHIPRSEAMGFNDNRLSNLSGDFEINSGIALVTQLDLSSGVMPEMEPFKFERYKTMEQYYLLLSQWRKKEEEGEKDEECQCDDSESSESSSDAEDGSPSDADGNCSNCGKPKPGEGQKNGDVDGVCDSATEEREAGADAAGVERASEAEKTIAKRNTATRIVEEAKNLTNRGNDPYYDFLMLAQRLMAPPKVSWKNVLRSVLSRSNDAICRGKADYSYRRPNRRNHGSDFIFPGMVQYNPTLYFGVDTSGSMTTNDYNALLNEVESIIKNTVRTKNGFKVFMVDVDIKSVKPVTSVSQINLEGGGGTDMSKGVEFINSLPRKETPDLFIMATDGGTDWRPYIEALKNAPKKYVHILLVTDENGYAGVPEELSRLCTVIDISHK